MKTKIQIILSVILLASCDKPDSVPTVDDVNNIMVDDNKMTPSQFMEKYCYGKTDNETCLKVSKAHKKNFLNNKSLPKGW